MLRVRRAGRSAWFCCAAAVITPLCCLAYAPVWPTQSGDAQSFLSNAAGPAPPPGWLYSVNGSLPFNVTTVPLPARTGASFMGTALLVDAHAVYTLSGAGATAQCSVNNTSIGIGGVRQFVNPLTVNAFSPVGTLLWSSPIALAPVDIPCNWTRSVWVQPGMALHPALPLLYLHASCVSNASTWAAFLTAVNTTTGACVWTRIYSDAASPPPSSAPIADCSTSQSFQFNYAVTAEAFSFVRVNASAAPSTGSGACSSACASCAVNPSYSALDDGALLLLRPNYTVNVLSSITGALISSSYLRPPPCVSANNASVTSTITSFSVVTGVGFAGAPQASVFFICVTPGAAVLNYSVVTLRMDTATGALAAPMYNATFTIAGQGGLSDARSPGPLLLGTMDTLYTAAYSLTATTASSNPNNIPQLPLTPLYNSSNGTQIASAVTNRAGIGFILNVPTVPSRQGSNIAPGCNLSMTAINMTAPIGMNVLAVAVNFSLWYPRTSNGSPWSAFPLTAGNDPIVPPVSGSVLGTAYVGTSIPTPDGNCSFNAYVLQLQVTPSGASTLSVVVPAVNMTNASCAYGNAYVVAGPRDGTAVMAVTPFTPSGAALVYLSTASQPPFPTASVSISPSSTSSASSSASPSSSSTSTATLSMNASASSTPSRSWTASSTPTPTGTLSTGASASNSGTSTATLSNGASTSSTPSSTSTFSTGASTSSTATSTASPTPGGASTASLANAGVSVPATVASVILCSLACGVCGCFTSWGLLTQRIVLPRACTRGIASRRRRLTAQLAVNPLMRASGHTVSGSSSASVTVLQLAAPVHRDAPRPQPVSAAAAEQW